MVEAAKWDSSNHKYSRYSIQLGGMFSFRTTRLSEEHFNICHLQSNQTMFVNKMMIILSYQLMMWKI